MSHKCNDRDGDGCLSNAMGECKGSNLLAVQRMAPVKVESNRDGGYVTIQDGFMMHTQKVETLEPFSSHVIPSKMTENVSM